MDRSAQEACRHKSWQGRTLARAHLFGTTAALALIWASPLAAQQLRAADPAALAQAAPFDIAPQPLASALTAFGRQSGYQVSVDQALLADLRSGGVQGTMTPEAALQILLSGTGLAWRLADARSVVLTKAPVGSQGITNLPPVTVEDRRNQPSNVMIGNLAPEYPGGQVARGGQLGLLGNRDIMETPFNTTSYTAKTIEDQQARTLGDVLANDPSVRANWPRGSYADNFMVRGFNLSSPNIAIGGLYGILPLDHVPLEMVERVEVLKGPSALLNGMSPGGMIGGNINIVPKRAGEQPSLQITGLYGSDSEFGSHVDIGRRFGPDNSFGARVNAAYRDGDTAIDRQTENVGVVTLGLDYRGLDLRLSADLGYQKQRVEAPLRPVYVAAIAPVPSAPDAGTNFFPSWSFIEEEDSFGVVRAEYDFLPNLTGFASVGARSFKSDNLLADPTVTNAQGQFTSLTYRLPYDQDSWTAETGLRGRFDAGPLGHEVSVIANTLQRTFYNSFTAVGSISSNLYNPSFSAVGPDLNAISDAKPRTSESDLSSLGIADTLSLFDRRILLTLGGRYQQVKVDNFNTTTGALTTSYDDSALTPAIGLVVKPWENVSLYGNYIEGLTQGPTAPNSAVNRGQMFAPFKSKQYEAGIKIDYGRFATTLSVFQIAQPSGITDPATLIFGVDGEQRNRGVEINTFGEIMTGVRLLGGIAFLDGELTKTAGGVNDGKTAVGVPDIQANLGAEWDAPFARGLTLAVRGLYTSSQYLNAANTQSIPSWTRLDLGARYRLETASAPIVIRFNVENVLDESYWASTGGGYLTAGAPRTFLLSTGFTF